MYEKHFCLAYQPNYSEIPGMLMTDYYFPRVIFTAEHIFTDYIPPPPIRRTRTQPIDWCSTDDTTPKQLCALVSL